MEDVRVTVAVARVLREFVDDVAAARYGYELMRSTGYASGKLYPILGRLQRAGWLIKEREAVDPAEAGRPVRRLYRLTPEGVVAARRELAVLSSQLAPSAPVPGRVRPGEAR